MYSRGRRRRNRYRPKLKNITLGNRVLNAKLESIEDKLNVLEKEVKEEEKVDAKIPIQSVSHLTASKNNSQAVTMGRQRRGTKRQFVSMNASTSPYVNAANQQLLTFADAVVDPFSEAAIGAMRPDKFQDPSLPTMDICYLDWDKNLFTAAGTNPLTSITGVIAFLTPRCLAAGWPQLVGGSPIIKTVSVGPGFSSIGTAYVPADLYSLGFAVIGGTSLAPTPNYFAHNPVTDSNVEEGVNFMQFTKFNNVETNASSARIIGGGIKIWSDEAPLVTGGRAYGGWISARQLGQLISIGPSSASSIENYILYPTVQTGVDGVTVRYSSIQTPKQEEFQTLVVPNVVNTTFSESKYGDEVKSIDEKDNLGASDDLPIIPTNTDVSVYDAMEAGDYLPVVVWRFNSDDIATSVYSLHVQARIHLQVMPNGSCPFMVKAPMPSPYLDQMLLLLNNRRNFPVAVKGHSFKSVVKVIKNINSILGKASKHFGLFLDAL